MSKQLVLLVHGVKSLQFYYYFFIGGRCFVNQCYVKLINDIQNRILSLPILQIILYKIMHYYVFFYKTKKTCKNENDKLYVLLYVFLLFVHDFASIYQNNVYPLFTISHNIHSPSF